MGRKCFGVNVKMEEEKERKEGVLETLLIYSDGQFLFVNCTNFHLHCLSDSYSSQMKRNNRTDSPIRIISSM